MKKRFRKEIKIKAVEVSVLIDTFYFYSPLCAVISKHICIEAIQMAKYENKIMLEFAELFLNVTYYCVGQG